MSMSEGMSESTVEMLVDEEDVLPVETKSDIKDNSNSSGYNYSRFEMKRIYDARKTQGAPMLIFGSPHS
jgi:hypothetical protein